MIKNLMFDLGGVIMDIKRENAVDALKGIGLRNAGEMLGIYGQKGIFLALEKGEITPAEFRTELRKEIDGTVTDEQIDEAFGKFLIGIPENRLLQLEELKKSYNIYLLSNTNPIMWYNIILDEFKKTGHNIIYYFDDLIASFDVRAYKPDAEIFLKAAEKFRIKPSETLFYDDSLANVKAAEALGFAGAHVADFEIPFADYIPR